MRRDFLLFVALAAVAAMPDGAQTVTPATGPQWRCIHPGLRPRLSLKQINRCTSTKPKLFGRSDPQTTPRMSRAGGNIEFR
jgi:hypothetical protein